MDTFEALTPEGLTPWQTSVLKAARRQRANPGEARLRSLFSPAAELLGAVRRRGERKMISLARAVRVHIGAFKRWAPRSRERRSGSRRRGPPSKSEPPPPRRRRTAA